MEPPANDPPAEGAANSEQFTNALNVLLGERFGSLDDAKMALERFKHQAASAMQWNTRFTAKDEKSGSQTWICAARASRCPFRLILRWEKKEETLEYRFYVGNDGGMHGEHDSMPPKRATAHALQVIDQTLAKGAAEGLRGLDLINQTTVACAQLGINITAEAIARQRREMAKRALQSRVMRDTNMEVLLKVGDAILQLQSTESSPDVAAIIGMLVHLQKKDQGAYIRLILTKGILQYVFVSTSRQRAIGSRFGEVQCYDDKHGVSTHSYHLAACTVMGNQKAELASFALMASSNGENWSEFVKDSKTAFLTTTGQPLRRVGVTISDDDGQIKSAVATHIPGAQRWSCWFHVKGYTRKHHLRQESQWSPVHETIDKLLECAVLDECKTLIQTARSQIGKMTVEALREKYETLLDEIELMRLRPQLKSFTQAWTSQSVAEGYNSIFERLEVGANVSLPLVLDKILVYCQRSATKTPVADRRKMPTTQATFLGQIQQKVTKVIFESLVEQYDQQQSYNAQKRANNSYNVSRKGKNDKVREVIMDEATKTWKSSCNERTYLGRACRHIMSAMFAENVAVDEHCVDSRFWLENFQPKVNLQAQSPFTSSAKAVTQSTALNVSTNEQLEQPIDNDNDKDSSDHDDDNMEIDAEARLDSQIGSDDGSDNDVIFQIDGKPVPIPLKPSEVRTEVRTVAYTAVSKCGTKVPLLRSLEAHINEWVMRNIPNEDEGRLSLERNRGATAGPPANSIGLKNPKRKPRINGSKTKVPYHCSICKSEGHTKAKCPKRKAEDALPMDESKNNAQSVKKGKKMGRKTVTKATVALSDE